MGAIQDVVSGLDRKHGAMSNKWNKTFSHGMDSLHGPFANGPSTLITMENRRVKLWQINKKQEDVCWLFYIQSREYLFRQEQNLAKETIISSKNNIQEQWMTKCLNHSSTSANRTRMRLQAMVYQFWTLLQPCHLDTKIMLMAPQERVLVSDWKVQGFPEHQYLHVKQVELDGIPGVHVLVGVEELPPEEKHLCFLHTLLPECPSMVEPVYCKMEEELPFSATGGVQPLSCHFDHNC